MTVRARSFAWSLLALLFVAAALPHIARAQLDNFNVAVFGTSVAITFSPESPGPGETVHLTLKATGIDLSASDIEWTAGGKVIVRGIGRTGTDVQTGILGSETSVHVDVGAPDGNIFSANATIAPAQIDLLMSADSYTPAFYRGRALPSAGSNIVVQATPRFQRGQTLIANADINFTWKRNGEVLANLSGRGKSSAVIPVLHMFGADTIEVSATSADGSRSGSARLSVPLVEPALELYQDHPLYGILYNRALPASARISESEMGFAAVPFFASVRSPNDTGLSYSWRVNDAPIAAAASSPSSITINAENSTGVAHVEVEVTHRSNVYMDASGDWTLTLSSSGAAQDPFRIGQ